MPSKILTARQIAQSLTFKKNDITRRPFKSFLKAVFFPTSVVKMARPIIDPNAENKEYLTKNLWQIIEFLYAHNRVDIVNEIISDLENIEAQNVNGELAFINSAYKRINQGYNYLFKNLGKDEQAQLTKELKALKKQVNAYQEQFTKPGQAPELAEATNQGDELNSHRKLFNIKKYYNTFYQKIFYERAYLTDCKVQFCRLAGTFEIQNRNIPLDENSVAENTIYLYKINNTFCYSYKKDSVVFSGPCNLTDLLGDQISPATLIEAKKKLAPLSAKARSTLEKLVQAQDEVAKITEELSLLSQEGDQNQNSTTTLFQKNYRSAKKLLLKNQLTNTESSVKSLRTSFESKINENSLQNSSLDEDHVPPSIDDYISAFREDKQHEKLLTKGIVKKQIIEKILEHRSSKSERDNALSPQKKLLAEATNLKDTDLEKVLLRYKDNNPFEFLITEVNTLIKDYEKLKSKINENKHLKSGKHQRKLQIYTSLVNQDIGRIKKLINRSPLLTAIKGMPLVSEESDTKLSRIENRKNKLIKGINELAELREIKLNKQDGDETEQDGLPSFVIQNELLLVPPSAPLEEDVTEQQLRTLQKDNPGLKKRLKTLKYTQEWFASLHNTYDTFDDIDNRITDEKRKRRTRKLAMLIIAYAIVFVVAFGEGMAAAVFFHMPILIGPAFFAIFAGGFICNWYLEKEDVKYSLKQFFFNLLLLDDDGISMLDKGWKGRFRAALILVVSFAFCLGLAVSFAFLSYSTFSSAVLAMGGTAALAYGLAVIPFLFTIPGLFAIVFVPTVGMMKKGDYFGMIMLAAMLTMSILQLTFPPAALITGAAMIIGGKLVTEMIKAGGPITFINKCWKTVEDMTWKQRIILVIVGIFMVAGLVAALYMGIMQFAATAFKITQVLNLIHINTSIPGLIVGNIFGGPLMAVFYGKGAMFLCGSIGKIIGEILYGIGNVAVNVWTPEGRKNLTEGISESLKRFKENPLYLWHCIKQSTKFTVVSAAAGANAYGLAVGYTKPSQAGNGAPNICNDMRHFPSDRILTTAAIASGFSASAGSNIRAIDGETKQPPQASTLKSQQPKYHTHFFHAQEGENAVNREGVNLEEEINAKPMTSLLRHALATGTG